MLADYIRQCNVQCDVLRNDNEQLLNPTFINNYNALILSPGPQTPNDAGYLMQLIKLYYLHKPILGVCLGHQAIGQFFGATLQKAITPKHGKVDTVTHNNNKLFNDISQNFNVTRYHSLILVNINQPLQIGAQTAKNEIMALYHSTLPIYGVQFHPESCLTQSGLTIIKNFTILVQQIST
jgi:anthranilate synthase component 2